MRKLLPQLTVVLILLALTLAAKAQKNIVISDTLAANADELKVKAPGLAFGKVSKYQFGEYAVVSGKLGWSSTTTKGNLLGTKSSSNAKQNFWFVMSNNANDTAKVDASDLVAAKYTHSLRVSKNFSLGSDELQQWAQSFTALITINNDTTETWALLMNAARSVDSAANYEAYLSNGDRKIILAPVTSNKKNDDKRMIPALGYEFLENNRAVCAVQYFGGGLTGRNRYVIWLDKSLDKRMKLLFAAAMATVLQQKELEM
jgi:hypothetical protein